MIVTLGAALAIVLVGTALVYQVAADPDLADALGPDLHVLTTWCAGTFLAVTLVAIGISLCPPGMGQMTHCGVSTTVSYC